MLAKRIIVRDTTARPEDGGSRKGKNIVHKQIPKEILFIAIWCKRVIDVLEMILGRLICEDSGLKL